MNDDILKSAHSFVISGTGIIEEDPRRPALERLCPVTNGVPSAGAVPAQSDKAARVRGCLQQAERSVVVFDLGGVLIDWDPRHLSASSFAGDVGTIEHFLSTVCTPEWNRCQDAGRSFAEGARLLKAEHPDKAELIDAYCARFDEMLAGPIPGWLEILAELERSRHAAVWPEQLLAETYAPAREVLCVPVVVSGDPHLG